MFIIIYSLFATADCLIGVGPATTAPLLSILFYAIAYPLFAVSQWIYAATTIKRLHDRNKSGWWIIPFFVLPVLLREVGGRVGVVALGLGLIAVVLGVWSLVGTFCLSGVRAPCRV